MMARCRLVPLAPKESLLVLVGGTKGDPIKSDRSNRGLGHDQTKEMTSSLFGCDGSNIMKPDMYATNIGSWNCLFLKSTLWSCFTKDCECCADAFLGELYHPGTGAFEVIKVK